MNRNQIKKEKKSNNQTRQGGDGRIGRGFVGPYEQQVLTETKAKTASSAA
jgi:hypothetical protein